MRGWAVLGLGLLVGLFSLAFLRTAWVTEDAFISFRVIDNVLHGHGLTWNPGARVQVFTHPLWLGLLTPLVALANSPYHAAIALGYACSVGTLLILVATLEGPTLLAFLWPVSLLWSRAFVDYSSSGLENALLHLLLAGYGYLAVRDEARPGRKRWLGSLAGAVFLTRPDALILLLPSLLAEVWPPRAHPFSRLGPLLLGLAPAGLWVCFSLFYYGAPVPNTALAKAQTGLPLAESARQAWAYLHWSLVHDRMTLCLLLGALGFGIGRGRGPSRHLALGLLAWFGYLVWVGADYMGGRFLSGAVVLAVLVLGRTLRDRPLTTAWALGLLLLLQGGALSFTVLSPSTFRNDKIDPSGIADERGFYYNQLGLIPVLRRGDWGSHGWFLEGRDLARAPGIYLRGTIGLAGYAAGPDVIWIDPLALADPFLARLPARDHNRVGHYERAFPPGFLESRLQGRNRLVDGQLAKLYDDVQWATQAPLLDGRRLGAIWRLNAGAHPTPGTAAFARNAIGLPGIPVETLSPCSFFGLAYGRGAGATWRLEPRGQGIAVAPVLFSRRYPESDPYLATRGSILEQDSRHGARKAMGWQAVPGTPSGTDPFIVSRSPWQK